MYELYVVIIMQEQKLKPSDKRIGVACKVTLRNQKGYQYKFAKLEDEVFKNFAKNDEVIVLTQSEHSTLVKKINDADIRTLKKDNEDLQKQIKNKNNSINTYKTNSVKNKATIEDLQEKVTKYKSNINNKDATIETLQKRITKYKEIITEKDALILKNNNDENIVQMQETIKEQASTISDLKEMNDAIAKEKDKIETQLDNSIDASELVTLQEQVNEYKSKYEDLIKDYTKTVDESLAYLEDIRELKETNKFLNEQIGALSSSMLENNTKMESKYQSNINELKETIKKQKVHIDEITDKYQSLLPKQEYITPKSHYDELKTLSDKLNDATNELNKTKADVETKLAIQKQELNDAHKDEMHQLKETHTNEKAQLLVAYNNDLNNSKSKYNELAMEYNQLLSDASSLTKRNTLFGSRHKEIIKGKMPMELLEIPSEQLPPANETTLEFIPKEQD